MNAFRMMLTRRNFLRYGGTLAASVAVHSRAADRLLRITPIRVALADYGHNSLPMLHAAMRSPNFEVLAICAPNFRDIGAMHQMCWRFGKTLPTLTGPREVALSPSIEALLLADDSEGNTQLAHDAYHARKKIFIGQPSRAIVLKDSVLKGSPPSLIHVGLLSAHDVQVSDAAAYVQRGGLGQVLGAQIFTPPSEEWIWLEALNITHLIFEKLDSAAIRLSPRGHEVVVPSKDGEHPVELVSTVCKPIRFPALRLRGTRGAIEIPLYTRRDRLEALSPMLEVFARAVRADSVSAHKSLEQTKRAHLLLTAAQRSVLKLYPATNGR
jgi:hypothetical protein